MEPRRINVFFYGLFMDVDLLIAKEVHPVQPRPASVPGFTLRIGQRATLIPNAMSCVPGVVMELSHAEIEELYSEPSVSAYRAEAVIAQLGDGSYIPAVCFNLVVPPTPEEANPEYAAKLRDLARRLNLPSWYVDSIH
jgi:hypothetical protein